MTKTRILLIEDNKLLPDALIAMLSEQADLTFVGAIRSGNTILRKAHETKPDVILLDVGLNNPNTFSVVDSVRKNVPDAKVVGIGVIPSQSNVVEFVSAGASGFILKGASKTEFLGTVRSIARGEKVLPPSLTDSLFSHVVSMGHRIVKGEALSAARITRREREIIALVAEGLSNKEIAQRLNLAIHTVKSHLHNIMEKLAFHSRVQIAKFKRDDSF